MTSNSNGQSIERIALLSVHGCPMAQAGTRAAGGMNVYLHQLAPLLARSGARVDIFTRSHYPGGPERADLGPGVRVVHLPAGPIDAPKEAISNHLPDFLASLERSTAEEPQGYDLVHSHYWFSGWVGQQIAAAWGVPHVVTFHTLGVVKERAGGAREPAERHLAEQHLTQHADSIVAFSEDERDTLIGTYNTAADRIHVIPGGVDLERFQPGDKPAARHRLGLDPQQTIVLYAGRLDPFKGPDILLDSFSRLPPRLPAHLVLVGGEGEADPEAERLHKLAVEMGVAPRVSWRSAIPQEELVDYYVAADILAMPSYHESFGLAALESMACGTPVVAVRAGALASLVVHEQTGYLVDTHGPAAFAQRLERALVDTPLREQMSRNAGAWARRFPWSNVANQLMDVYWQAVS